MLRFLTGAGAATLLLLAGFFIWKGVASRNENPVPAAPAATEAAADVPLTPGRPPSADARTREQRRFDRADRDNVQSLIFWVGGVPEADMTAADRGEKTLPSLHSPYWAPDAEQVIATASEAMAAATLDLMARDGG